MKIVTPLCGVHALDSLFAAGAEEFYIDISEQELEENDYLEEAAKEIHARNGKIYIHLNIFMFYKLEMNAMEHYLEYLAKCRMDGVAVNIPELVPIIRGLGMKAIASAQCEIQTGGLAQWYQKIGISRIIFPETIVYRDIQSVSHTVPEIEYEVLLMRQDCFRGKGMETVPTCGQCALYHLLHSGVTNVKILSNSEDWALLLSDINLTKQNIEIASQCESEEEYLRKMILPEYRNIHCGERFSCYYPEVC